MLHPPGEGRTPSTMTKGVKEHKLFRSWTLFGNEFSSDEFHMIIFDKVNNYGE